jgi:outer membrane cobalamin receptor
MKKIIQLLFENFIAVMLLSVMSTKLSQAEDVELERIVVAPSRIEQFYGEVGRKIDVISKQDLKNLAPKDISEVLEDIPSVNISDYGSLGAKKIITMRGSTEKQVLIMVDGRPINNPRSGDIELNTIPLDNIERIEVLRGPASSLYGSSAMGGVVNIITKQPPEKGQKTKLLSSFGTFRTYQETLSHGGRFSNFGYQINSSYQSSEGYRDNAEFNAKDVNSKLIYERNPENKLTLQGGFYKDKLGTPGTITSPDLNDKQIDRKNFFDLQWEVKPWQDKDIELSMRTYQNYDRLEFIETPEPLDKTTHTTKSRAINLNFNQAVTRIYRAIWGFDWTENLNDSTASAKHEYTVRAGYLENQLDLFKNLKINFGARLDDYSNFGTEINPNFSLVYEFSQNTKLHSLIGRSFRAPTFNDLYWPLSGSSAGNPNLRPEEGITGEFGIEKRFSKFLKIELTYFRSDYNNLIQWQEGTDNIYRPQNISSAIIQGVEQKFKIEPFDNLDVDMGYTYLRAKDDKTHKYLTYQPKYKVNFSINYKGFSGFKIGLKGEFVDRRFDNATNTIYVKRYYVLGVKLSKDISKRLNLFLKIDNLLNKKYQSRRNYPMPGFSITTGMKLDF